MITHDQYHVVFDLSQKAFEWWFPAFGLIFVAIGGVILSLGRIRNWPRSRTFVGYFMIGFACLWSGVAFSTTFREYVALHSAYGRSQFSVVEGRVTNFRPMPHEGHQPECFSVQSQTFCYSDYEVTAGFNNSTSHGGLFATDFLFEYLTSVKRLFVWKSGAMLCHLLDVKSLLRSLSRTTGFECNFAPFATVTAF